MLRALGDILGQKVVGRDQLVLLVEDLDRPADHTRLLALQRLGPDGELHAQRISRIKRRQEAQVLEPGIGEDWTGIGPYEQPGSEAQDQIAVRDAALEDR